MNNYKLIKKCLLCDGNIRQIISFGETPLANEFVESPRKQDIFPLNLVQCIECNHVQIDCIVDQHILYSNYYYVSGTSPVNVKHFEEYARKIMFNHLDIATFKNGDILPLFDEKVLDKLKNKIIIDIGSNDGTFLRCFKNYGLNVIGVDPAKDIANQANKDGIPTIVDFFNKETALKIKNKLDGKQVDIITCNNMFAHNENLQTIIDGVLELLDKNGTFVIENSYLLDICDKSLIDLVYHEHMHHHHIGALQKFLEKSDLQIYKVDRLPNHGGSIRVYIKRGCAIRGIHHSVNDLIKTENNLNEKLNELPIKIKNMGMALNTLLNNLKAQGKSIAIYGVPAKATTLMYALDIDEKMIDFAVDDAPLKQGTFTPGKHIPVLPTSAIYKGSPDVLLVLAWNFADSIMKKHSSFRGTWIVPIPELKEYNV